MWIKGGGQQDSRLPLPILPTLTPIFVSNCFSFNASGQDLVWINDFCAKVSENHPPVGIVSVLIPSEYLFSVLPMLHFHSTICAEMSTFP
jgi:hypothetical protein